MAKMSSKTMKGYAAYKKKETKSGMHMMNGKLMKNSAMKGKTKRMGKVK